MIQLFKITFYVLKGFHHDFRIRLFRWAHIPYPALKTSGTVKFNTKLPWPQPSPISPQMPYAVLHLPPSEIKEFILKIVSRFERTIKYSWLAASRYLSANPYLNCPDDETFSKYLVDGVYSYFFTNILNEADLKFLQTNGISAPSIFKSDLTPISTMVNFKNLYCTGSTVYFSEKNNKFELLAITMVDSNLDLTDCIFPTDGDAWKLAKMHVLQGAVYLSLFVTHPRCHFPMDALNAITKTILPKNHTIFKLLEPHFYLQLPLNYSVLHIKNGPGYNDPLLYYTAFSGAGHSQYRLFEFSFAGFPGHSIFKPYIFGYLLNLRETDYQKYLLGYYAVVLNFVQKVVANLEIDEALLEWAAQCSHHTKGFISAEEIKDKELLAACLATIIWNCSIVHSSDHKDFYLIPMDHKPTRLRVEPPYAKKNIKFQLKDLTREDDRLRQWMWHELYVKPWPLKALCEIDYQFKEADLKKANQEFIEQLFEYDANLKTKRYIPLKEICTSIQY